jgi:arylsulfatase A-like enzyme/Flp pilus assembly protein TadD
MQPRKHENTKKTLCFWISCLRGFVVAFVLAVSTGGWGCSNRDAGPRARNLVLITIDTLRADHVGAYGYTRAQTATLDELARTGVRFDRAYAAAPITLPSHATLLSGRYPPSHGARDNGMAAQSVPTLATVLKAKGFKTAAFVGAFPLDHQFGLDRGFDVYSDRLGRDATGRPANERPAAQVVDEAIAWIGTTNAEPRTPNSESPRFFLWVHLFDPHAPYGDASAGRPVLERYDEDIATADREAGRLLKALGARTDTLVVAASDHGEAFGEHGEYAHSIFVYDTTLRVPLIMNGPGLRAVVVPDAVSLVDVAPTAARLLGVDLPDALPDISGIDVSATFSGRALGARELYAESFAPLVEFGWAPLRAVRSGAWKYIAAPTPELYYLERDSAEQTNVVSGQEVISRSLSQRVNQFSSDLLTGAGPSSDPKVTERLRALGYVSGGQSATSGQRPAQRPDPKDRRDLAARIAQVTSGELQGGALIDALEGLVRDDPQNGQANLRLGYARLQSGDCARAEPAFRAAAAAGLPSADVYLGLATCLGRRRDLSGAEEALANAQRLEPDNPVVVANVGILQASKGDTTTAIETLKRAIDLDPSLLEARFNLALAYARAGRRDDARVTAQDLLARLPANAPQRAEVGRLLQALK